MLISHAMDGDTLCMTMHDQLDVTSRAAASLEIEAAVHTHRPGRMTVRVPAGEPTPATLSAVVRAHRMCAALGIPLSLTGATDVAPGPFHWMCPSPHSARAAPPRSSTA
ncbi:hypothetical protein [Streptomyces sp. NPDC051909]|uniref:hypothetical protein n=1 Tax=Streptomyces sp. NPDC051909 TaxID=3154944 RepID=UPI0034417ED7